MREDVAKSSLTGWHALTGFAGFFAVVFLANGVMLYFALATHSGVETADAYRRGLAYNARIADGEAQLARGWKQAVQVERRLGQVEVEMTNADGHGVSGLRLAGVIGRPATGEYDRRLVFRETGRGKYVADAGAMAAGNWILALEALELQREGESAVHRTKRRLWLTP